MATTSRKYSTSHRAADGRFITTHFSSKARAIKAAAALPGLVRVQTPAGNLVKYVDNRPANDAGREAERQRAAAGLSAAIMAYSAALKVPA